MSNEPESIPMPPELQERSRKAQELLDAGNLPEAAQELTALLAGHEEVVGPHHPACLSTRLLLARVLALVGEPDLSEQFLLPLRDLPEDHPAREGVLVEARGIVAQLRRLQGRHEEAFQIAASLLAQFDAKDPVTPESFRAMVLMAELAREADQYQQALDVCAAGIERFQGKVGEAHAHLLLLAGSVLQSADDLPRAREHFEAILSQASEQLGGQNELSARAHHLLGLLERDEDRPELAVEQLEKCLASLPEQADPELRLETEFQLALLRAADQEPNRAAESLRACRTAVERIHGPRSPRTAEVLAAEGFQLRRGGDLAAARERYEAARSILASWRAPEDAKLQVLEKTLAELAAAG